MQQRRVYVDDWSLLEKLCLVSAIQRFGENWASICEYIKPKLQEERQWDWFTAETCEAQYKQLYSENVKSSINNENPLQQIVHSLKLRCRIEGQPLEEQRNKYLTLKKILETTAKNEIGEDQLDKYYEKALQAKQDREENRRKYQELLKKRDLAKVEYEKIDTTKSPNKMDSKFQSDASSPVMTSPLLSSLLNNPPAVQYRPTLSTSSFIQTKVPQSQSSSPSRQSNIFNNTASIARRLSFPDIAGSPTSDSHSILSKDSLTPKETTPTPETSSKTNAQNLESLVLISPNEEYLSEVDIPPETLLEVIDNLKEGTLSLDKIIRDLEAGGDENIINKDNMASVNVEETYIATIENEKPAELTVKSQPCSEIITVSDNTISSITPKTGPIPIDGTIVQSDHVFVINQPTSEEPSIIGPPHNNVSSPPSTLKSIECESSVSQLSSISVTIEGLEAVTIEEKTEADTEQNRNIPSIDTESSNPTVEHPQQVNVAESVECVSKLQEVDVLAAEDSQLSGDGYVTCESTSDADEMMDSSAIDQEPPVLSKIDEEETQELELHKENDSIDERRAKLSDETAAETISAAEFEEPATAIVTVLEPEAKATLASEIVDGSETAVKEVVEPVKDVNKYEELVDSQPPPLNHMITGEVVEKIESKREETSYKRQLSITSRRSELKIQLENECQSLESIPEDSVPAIKPPQLQAQVPTESNVVAADVEKRILRTPEKEFVDNGEEDSTKSRLSARKETRKRKSLSESNETTPVKITRKMLDSSENETLPTDKELNITIKDLCDNMDASLKAELLQPKEEPFDKELAIELTPTPAVEKLEIDRNSEPRRPTKPRRSSARTQSPAVKQDSTPSSSSSTSDDSELARTRRKSILLAYSRLMSHKYSNAFQKPITNKQVPGYDNIIYNPMDLHTIKRKIDNRQITTVVEFQRDVLLMLNNAKMFNQVNSQVYNMAVEVEKDTLDHLKVTVQALGEGILRREEKTNVEKIRKRQSLDNARKDSKSVKRMKSIGKDDIVPIKKIKTEENDDHETHT